MSRSFIAESFVSRLRISFFSGANRNLSAVKEDFTSADKNILSFKDMLNALMTEIRDIKGADFWFESVSGIGTIPMFMDLALTTITGAGRVEHSSTVTGRLDWPDLKLKPITTSTIYTVTAGNDTLADGEVLYIDIDEGGNRGVTGSRTMVKAARASVPFDGDTYWIAFRDDNGGADAQIYFRNVGLLHPGESQVVGEEGEKDFIVDRNTKLVRGGIWSWDLANTKLTWSSNAFIQVPGLAEADNQINAGNNTDLDADGKVLYVDINRSSGGGALSVTGVAIGSFVNTQNRFIIARRIGDQVVVGTHSQLLGDDQQITLEDMDTQANDMRCKAVADDTPSKDIYLWPSQRTSNNKRIYTYILPNISSKFPRVSYSTGDYDGGASDNQLTTISFSDPAAGTVTVTATGSDRKSVV